MAQCSAEPERCTPPVSFSTSTMPVGSKPLLRFSKFTCLAVYQNYPRLPKFTVRSQSNSCQEFKVVLDGETLYVERSLAEALGWKHSQPQKSVTLRLNGCAPTFFTITPSDTDSGRFSACNRFRLYTVDALVRATVQSLRNPNVRKVLDYLKDR